MNEKEVEALIDRILVRRKMKSSEDGVVTVPYKPELKVGTVFQFTDSNEKFVVCECKKEDWPCDKCEFNAARHKDAKLVIKRLAQCNSFGCTNRSDDNLVFAKKVEE